MKNWMVIAIFVLFMSSLGATQSYSQSFDLYLNEEASFGNYSFEFDDITGEQQLKISEKVNNTNLILGRFEQEELYDSVGINRNVNEGLNFTLQSVEGDEDGLYLNILVDSDEQIFASSELDSDAPSRVYIAKGETLDLNLELENTGIIDEEYNLSTDSRDLEASFGFQGFNISSVEVESGESVSLSGEIEVPESAEVGTRNLTVIAEDESRAEENILLDIRGARNPDPEISQDLQESFVRTSPGESVSIPVRVSNGGSAGGAVVRGEESNIPDLTDVGLEVDAPEDWEVTVTPESVSSLSRYDGERFVIELRPPEDVEAGDHFVDINAVSNEVSAEVEQARVNVTEQSLVRYIGIVLMIFSVGALVVVYRKFGRR